MGALHYCGRSITIVSTGWRSNVHPIALDRLDGACKRKYFCDRSVTSSRDCWSSFMFDLGKVAVDKNGTNQGLYAYMLLKLNSNKYNDATMAGFIANIETSIPESVRKRNEKLGFA